jgi:hypothetical protein
MSGLEGRPGVACQGLSGPFIAITGHAILSKDYLKRIFLLCCGDNTILVWFNPPIPKTFSRKDIKTEPDRVSAP